MEQVSLELIGSYTEEDIIGKDNAIIIKKGTLLTKKHIVSIINQHIEHINVRPIEIHQNIIKQILEIQKESSQPAFWDEYLASIQATKGYFNLIQNGIYEYPDMVLLKIHELTNALEDFQEFLEFVYSIQGIEETLYRHTVNISILSYVFGSLNNYLENPMLLCQMGFLHDIGKVKIDSAILDKSTKLTEEEMNTIKNHTIYGADIIKQIGVENEDIKNAVQYHHESRKGTGYPYKLAKEQIPLSVQIITVLDAFDTICSERPYKKGKHFFEALKILYYDALNGDINPIIVFNFIENIYSLYIDKNVTLSDGTTGTVYFMNETNILRPIILYEGDTFCDLSKMDNVYISSHTGHEKKRDY